MRSSHQPRLQSLKLRMIAAVGSSQQCCSSIHAASALLSNPGASAVALARCLLEVRQATASCRLGLEPSFDAAKQIPGKQSNASCQAQDRSIRLPHLSRGPPMKLNSIQVTRPPHKKHLSEWHISWCCIMLKAFCPVTCAPSPMPLGDYASSG